jgi:hypothetical protein
MSVINIDYGQAKLITDLGTALENAYADGLAVENSVGGGTTSYGPLANYSQLDSSYKPAIVVASQLIAGYLLASAKVPNYITPTLGAGIAAPTGGYAGAPLFYKTFDNDIIMLGGVSGDISSGLLLATMPVNYRPAAKQRFVVTLNDNSTLNVSVDTNGEIRVASTGSFTAANVGLGGIRYKAI